MTPAEKLIGDCCTPNELPKKMEEGRLYATHSGKLKLGEGIEIGCHILNNGQRVFDADDVKKYFGDFEKWFTDNHIEAN